jgi:hypothetical protein
LNRRLDGPQNWSRRFAEEKKKKKNLFAVPEIEKGSFSPQRSHCTN